MTRHIVALVLLPLACRPHAAKRPGSQPFEPNVQSSGPEVPRTQALLFINSVPWGSLYIDGKLIGNLPQVAVVAPGAHTIRVVREGYLPYERHIALDSGGILRITDVVLQER